MSAEPAEKRIWSAPEYLAWERLQPTKHEFFQGEIFAMAAATRAHNLVVANIGAELRNTLREKPCEVLISNMRVKIAATGFYAYPDVIVVSGKAELEDAACDTLLNPRVLIEVLSESSESYDRGKKFEQYRSIDGLAEYVLVAQDRVLVEHFSRQPDGSWLLREARAGGRLTLPAIDCTIEVDDLYAKVFG